MVQLDEFGVPIEIVPAYQGLPSYAPALVDEVSDMGAKVPVVGIEEAEARQKRRMEYWRIVLPKMLELTKGHPLGFVKFSKSTGWFGKDKDKKKIPLPVRNIAGTPVVINTPQEITDLMSRNGKFAKGPYDKGLVTMFYVPNISGKNLRYIIWDFDIANTPEEEVRPKVLAVMTEMEAMGLECLPVFTGSSWHLWCKKPGDVIVGDYGGIHEQSGIVTEYIVPITTKLNIPVRGSVGHVEGQLTVDYQVNKANSPVRIPLSLHHKTGLVAIPLTRNEVPTMKNTDAHPVNVLKNIDMYYDRLQKFFTFNRWYEAEDVKAFSASDIKCPKCGGDGWLDPSGNYDCVKCGHLFKLDDKDPISPDKDPLSSHFAPSGPYEGIGMQSREEIYDDLEDVYGQGKIDLDEFPRFDEYFDYLSTLTDTELQIEYENRLGGRKEAPDDTSDDFTPTLEYHPRKFAWTKWMCNDCGSHFNQFSKKFGDDKCRACGSENIRRWDKIGKFWAAEGPKHGLVIEPPITLERLKDYWEKAPQCSYYCKKHGRQCVRKKGHLSGHQCKEFLEKYPEDRAEFEKVHNEWAKDCCIDLGNTYEKRKKVKSPDKKDSEYEDIVTKRTKELLAKSDVKVTKVGKDVLKDYAGMNREAGKAMGFEPLPKDGEIFVDKDLDEKEFKATVKHEAVEQELMKKGEKYWSAHKKALKAEKYASPLNGHCNACNGYCEDLRSGKLCCLCDNETNPDSVCEPCQGRAFDKAEDAYIERKHEMSAGDDDYEPLGWSHGVAVRDAWKFWSKHSIQERKEWLESFGITTEADYPANSEKFGDLPFEVKDKVVDELQERILEDRNFSTRRRPRARAEEFGALSYNDYKEALEGEGWAQGDYKGMIAKADTKKEKKVLREIHDEESHHEDELLELMDENDIKKYKAPDFKVCTECGASWDVAEEGFLWECDKCGKPFCTIQCLDNHKCNVSGKLKFGSNGDLDDDDNGHSQPDEYDATGPSTAGPSGTPDGSLSHKLFPHVKALVKAKKEGDTKAMKKHEAHINAIAGPKVIPASFTEAEKKDPHKLAKTISCISQVKGKSVEGGDVNPFAVCRDSVMGAEEFGAPRSGLSTIGNVIRLRIGKVSGFYVPWATDMMNAREITLELSHGAVNVPTGDYVVVDKDRNFALISSYNNGPSKKHVYLVSKKEGVNFGKFDFWYGGPTEYGALTPEHSFSLMGFAPGDIVRGQDWGGGIRTFTLISPTLSGSFYAYVSDDKGDVTRGGTRGAIPQDVFSPKGPDESWTKLGHKELTKRTAVFGEKEYDWWVTGHDEIDRFKMPNLDARMRLFQEHADKKQKAKYKRWEDINKHSENADMVNRFAVQFVNLSKSAPEINESKNALDWITK